MKLIHYKSLITVVALGSGSLLTACNEKEGASSESSSGSKTEAGKPKEAQKKVKASDVARIAKEVRAYKKEIGYETPAEAKEMSRTLSTKQQQLIALKKEHPAIVKLDEEAAESKAKLLQAVSDKDEEGKRKWGPIAADYSGKRMLILEETPEIVALQREVDELSEHISQIEHNELSKTPQGKELADKLKATLDAYTNRFQ